MKVAIAMIASLCALDALAAPFERTIEAPERVGDVVALTNALTQFNALTDEDRKNARIYLRPGLYNLSGVYMSDSHHLLISSSVNGLFAGLGEKPGDTILLGGGASGKHGVLKMAGGGNWSFNTVSNLTITGGDSPSYGGGISGDRAVVYRMLIVSNNIARTFQNGGGGGGCSYGRAYNCLFADNHTSERWGGGFLVAGRSNRNENEGQGAWDCVFIDNSAAQHGGGLAIESGGQCHGCGFTNNTAVSKGGGIYVMEVDYATYEGTPLKSSISNGSFSGNGGEGSGVFSEKCISISNCVFRHNIGKITVKCADMKDCTIECNTNSTGVICNSGMDRCVIRGNAVKNRFATAIDYCDSDVAHCTNVNCLVESNGYLEEFGKVLYNKSYINCTIVGNYMPNGSNFGYLERDCTLWNCVLVGNKISVSTERDVRTKDSNKDPVAVSMESCVFTTSDIASNEIGKDGGVLHDGLSGCRQFASAKLKFADAESGDYTPTYKSPLYNSALSVDWIISIAGAKDLGRNLRLFGSGMDIGAYECQCYPPGLVLSVK